MGNMFLVFLKLGQKHCVFSVFETSGASYLCIVFFVFLKLGQKHSVFCVFGDPGQCFSHLGPGRIPGLDPSQGQGQAAARNSYSTATQQVLVQ